MPRADRAAPRRPRRARAAAAAALVAAAGGVLAFAPAGAASRPAAAEARPSEAQLEEAAAAESRAFGFGAGAVGAIPDTARADEERVDFSYSPNAFDDKVFSAAPLSFQQLCDLSEMLEWIALGMSVAVVVALFRFGLDGSAARLIGTVRSSVICAAVCVVVDILLVGAAGGRPLPGLFQSYY
ncbi:unnamed protein product [Prorocentrum cordatum]|uniref:Uncharacterized protein n=1 Tax=Prorocentrum cordatum TaxID=2364126 RepID=A0ABN9T1U3_9DINO|nr:unnamed protein product [Polarella glacialis]